MTDYTKATNFATKDALVTGDPLKVVKGTEIDDEFNAIEDAIGTKANILSPIFQGVPKAPTAAEGTNTTQIATTAFVSSSITTAVNDLPTDSVCSAQIAANCVTADELNVAGNGTEGQVLVSDGDGSFSWEDQEVGLATLDIDEIGMVAFLGIDGDSDNIPNGISVGDEIDTATAGFSLYRAAIFADSGVDNNGAVIHWGTNSLSGAPSVADAVAVTGTWKALGNMYKMTSANWRAATLFVRIA